MPSDPSLTNPSTLPKVYDPQSVESRWYEVWEKSGYFQPRAEGKAYSMVIPPPNVTGSLHMGHALNTTLQDALIRYRKMKGDAALWVPGTDHGGIATQNVVEKILMKEKISRHQMGREKFLERMWSWRARTGDTILRQSRRLGAALDWTRARFTMDEVCSKAVRHAFVELYRRKLLYRGKRLVNWCPRCSTALADIEVEHKNIKSHLWHIKYPLIDRRHPPRPEPKKKRGRSIFEQGFLTVATTRPETMLGDTAVAVHPKDSRYRDFVGVKVKLPLTRREIPIVADDLVDKSFGSGAVKVTPSHDPVDFEIAERQKLPHIDVIGFDGKMTEDAGRAFEGLDRFEARQKVVEDLRAQGLLEKVEEYDLALSVCYRCDDVIEPLESEQWFLSMAQMAQRARDAMKKGRVRIVPESWENPYRLWLRNLKDWCVSRQIWWGHRIPVWYCLKEKEGSLEKSDCPPIVQVEAPQSCPTCENQKLSQDPDVLDTWFSSALWPFSVFHWPEPSEDLKRFFPTSTLVTGHEILYLWVARMVMFALEFFDEVPYSTVLIHGIVRDKKGRKMSKSLGNVIDPIDLINEFGADAVRFSLSQSAAPGRDMHVSKENFVSSRNFANKIWNASRFCLMHIRQLNQIPELNAFESRWELPDRWILHCFNNIVEETTRSMETFDFDAAARGLYDFFWSDFCDWYLEMVKPRLDPPMAEKMGYSEGSGEVARVVLARVLEGVLRLLHPFMPFISEELWQKLPKPAESSFTKHLMNAPWPVPRAPLNNPAAAKEMGVLQEMVTKLRAIRSEMGIPVTQPIDVLARSSRRETTKLLREHQGIFTFLNSRVGKIVVSDSLQRPKASATAVVQGADLYVPLKGLIDFGKERTRLEKELSAIKQDVDRLNKKLANQDFLTHAPSHEVDKAKSRLRDSKERAKRLEENIATLS